MDDEPLKKRLKENSDPAALVSEAAADPAMLKDLLAIVETDPGSLKFLCTKIIRLVSEQQPDALYGYFDEIEKLTRHPNSCVKWDGITILANLTGVDTMGKFDRVSQSYFNKLKDPQMVTAANVVKNAWKIALHKPHLESAMTKQILAIPGITYYYKGEPSPECNRILCGHVLECFEKYFDKSVHQKDMLEFARQQINNPRRQVAARAARFLKKYASPQKEN